MSKSYYGQCSVGDTLDSHCAENPLLAMFLQYCICSVFVDSWDGKFVLLGCSSGDLRLHQHVTAWHGDDDSGVRFLVGAMTTKRGEAGERDSVSGQVSCQDLADHELGLLAQSNVLPCSELLHGKNWVVQLPRRWRCWRKHTALLTQGVCSGATTEQFALTSGHKHVVGPRALQRGCTSVARVHGCSRNLVLRVAAVHEGY